MKISLNWLQEYIDTSESIESISNILTAIGLEVESVENFESIKGGLKDFFVGEIISCSKHPNADKLSLTEVYIGEKIGVKKIVCGDPNVVVGQKVVVALEGAIIRLSSGEEFTIKNSKIRGEESQGMICAEDEIGVGNNHDGILVLASSAIPGSPASDYFEIFSDTVFEIGLTPNRTDAMSHYGVARDLAAAMKAAKIEHKFYSDGKTNFENPKPTIASELKINIQSNLAPVYSLSEIENVATVNSPSWMSQRLRAIGENSKNALVDITNYILHDLGQPLHAYAYDSIQGDEIVVKNNNNEEEFVALNGVNYKLKFDDIIIRDGSNCIGLAGIIGSESSAVNSNTKKIIIEVAYFDGKAIRKSSQRINYRSEASSKFEKGVDPNGILIAHNKARKLIASIFPEAKFSEIIVGRLQDYENYKVSLTLKKLNQYGNMEFSKFSVEEILISLGIEILEYRNETWSLAIPRYKEDVKREEDVIEEVLRIYGYNNLPAPKFLRSNISFSKGVSRADFEEEISNLLVSSGYSEVMTNSISQSRYMKEGKIVKLLNSMTSELDSMREGMMPGFLEVIEYNLNRENRDLNIFEIGNVYRLDEAKKYTQKKVLAIAIVGMKDMSNWTNSKGLPNDYYQIKHILEKLFLYLRLKIEFGEIENKEYDYGMQIITNGIKIGEFGLQNVNQKLFDIKAPIFSATIDFEALYQYTFNRKSKYIEVPKFPIVKRDLAIILDDSIQYSQIQTIVNSALKNKLIQLSLFDIFKDSSLGENKKSYAIRMTIQDKERTMLDSETDELISRLVKKLENELNATIRK